MMPFAYDLLTDLEKRYLPRTKHEANELYLCFADALSFIDECLAEKHLVLGIDLFEDLGQGRVRITDYTDFGAVTDIATACACARTWIKARNSDNLLFVIVIKGKTS